MKKVLIIAFFIVFGLTVGLFTAEGIVRILASRKVIDMARFTTIATDPWTYSQTLMYRPKPYATVPCALENDEKKPGKCTINKDGMRDRDYTVEKSPNTFRIIVLGDSMTYGLGVNDDQSYPELLEKKLNSQSRKEKLKFEVINMGMTFYGPAQYYNLYKEVGQKYNPDIIIVGFHLLTDTWDSLVYEKNSLHFFYRALPDKVIPFTINEYFKSNSYLWRIVLGGYYSWANKMDKDVVKDVIGSNDRFQYETQLNISSSYMKHAWDLTEKHIQNLVNDAHSENSKIMILAIPSKAQIVPNEWEKIKRRGMVSDKKLYEDSQSRKKLLSLCNSYSWSCLDIQANLRKSESQSSLFIGEDFHFTPYGNEKVAGFIYEYLVNKKMLDK